MSCKLLTGEDPRLIVRWLRMPSLLIEVPLVLAPILLVTSTYIRRGFPASPSENQKIRSTQDGAIREKAVSLNLAVYFR